MSTATLGNSATTVTAYIAHDTGASTAEASNSPPSTVSKLAAVIPSLASCIAETIEEYQIQESISISGHVSDMVGSLRGLPGCDSASAGYVYSAWKACFSAESKQPIYCSTLD